MSPRFALVTSSLPDRRELRPSSIDAQYLLDVADEITVDVFVDHDTRALTALRDAGIWVHVSDKRRTELPGEGDVWADVVQARLLLQRHEVEPYDAILYSAERAGDLSWHEPALRDVPRGIVVADGPTTYQRLLLDDPELAAQHARELWARSGPLVASDLIVSNLPLRSYGLAADQTAHRYRTWGVSSAGSYDGSAPELVAVVATDQDRRGLSTLLRRVAERIEIADHTTVVVVHRELDCSGGYARELIRNGCPPHLRASTILVPASRDGVAYRFLQTADLICCASVVDLSLGAVADLGASVQIVELTGSGIRDDGLALEAFVPPQRDGISGEVAVLPVAGPPDELVALLDDLDDAGKASSVVLHQPDHAAEAMRISGLPTVRRVDVTLVSRPGVPFGDGDPEALCPHLLAVHRRSWSSLRRLLRRATSLEELVLHGFDASAMDTINLDVVPCGEHDCEGRRPARTPWADAWTEGSGIFPRPRGAAGSDGALEADSEPAEAEREPAPRPSAPTGPDLRSWVKETHWKDRARLALPWRVPALRRAVASESDLPVPVKRWVKDHRWTDRARLALPWKWGLLPKAMEGRW